MAGYVSPARRQLRWNASVFILIAIACSLVASLFGDRSDDLGKAGASLILVLIAVPCWVLGLMAYAQSKGYSRSVGLVGVLGCLGLLVLAVLRNRWVEAPPTEYVPGDYPRPNG